MKSSVLLRKVPWSSLALAVVLGLTILVLFAPVLNCGFVNWDDDLYVYNNPAARGLSPEHIRYWFTRSYVNLYVPLPMLSYALDHHIYGLDPGGYHRTHLALHCANAVLVFFILRFFFKSDRLSFLGAMLFAVHPAQVESVAWISERKNLLFSFFYLASFLLFIREPQARGKKNLCPGLIVVLFIAALLSKITAVMGLGMFAAYDYYFAPGEASRKQIFYGLGFFAVILASLATLNLYPEVPAVFLSGNGAEFFFRQADKFIFYLKKIFCPTGLGVTYPYRELFLLDGMRRLVAALSIALLGVSLGVSLLKKEKCGFWLLWFLGFLAPVVTLFPVPLGDRHLYLPLLGLIAFLATLLCRWPKILLSLFAALIVICIPLTRAQISVWKDSETLWRNVLKNDPDNFQASMKLANYYEERHDVGRAISMYQEVIAKYPRAFPYPYLNLYNRFIVSHQDGKAGDVGATFNRNYPEAPDLGVLYGFMSDLKSHPEAGVKFLEAAMGARSGNPGAYLAAGKIYLLLGNYEKSRNCLETALSLGANEMAGFGRPRLFPELEALRRELEERGGDPIE